MTRRPARLRFLLVWAIAALVSSSPHAAITPNAAVKVLSGTGVVSDPAIAYDPTTGIYLAVFTYTDVSGPWGLYLNQAGVPISAPFLIVNGNGLRPRVAAGNGKFLVSYRIGTVKQAVILRYLQPTAGPVTVDTADFEQEAGGSGVAYAPAFDSFLVLYHRAGHTYIRGVRSNLTLSSVLRVTETTGECIGRSEILNNQEIAYDSVMNRALVVGWRDSGECGGNGGIWTRLIAYDGTTPTPVLAPVWPVKGGLHDDAQVAFSSASSSFLVVWSKYLSSTTRSVLGQLIGRDGLPSGGVTSVLEPNLATAVAGDNAFNELTLRYNTTSGRFLLGMRGNDGDFVFGRAPVYLLELNGSGAVIPGTLRQIVDPISRPYPAIAYSSPSATQFLVLYKPVSELELNTVIVNANGVPGPGGPPLPPAGTPPPPPPPPPPPSGMQTLTVTKPVGGTVYFLGHQCGDAGADCSISLPVGVPVGLDAIASPGRTFGGWGGACTGGASALIFMTTSKTCSVTFNGTGAPPPPPPPASTPGTPRLVISPKPTAGTIFAAGIQCGIFGNACSVNLPAGIRIGLDYVGSGFAGWNGDADCRDGLVTVNGTVTCSAGPGSAPAPAPPPSPSGAARLTIINPASGGGGGTVFGAGFACTPGGGNCSVTYSPGTPIGLDAIPFPGFFFGGWIGAGCSNFVVMNGPLTCTADFNRLP